MRTAWVGVCLVVVLAACSGGTLTISEYAGEVERLVAEMEASFVSLDEEWESESPTVDGAMRYWDRRLGIRNDFLNAVRELQPPEEVEDQHEAAVDVFGRIAVADEAIAAQVATYETVSDHRPWADTPEGQASLAVLEEVYAFCRSSQAEYDETIERRALEDVPWLPSEMREIVRVAFGCPPPE